MNKDRFIELCNRSKITPFIPGRNHCVELVGCWKEGETTSTSIYNPRVTESNEAVVKAKVVVERAKYQKWLDELLLSKRKNTQPD